MSMDAAALSAVVKEMQEANAAGKSDDVVRLLKKLKTDVVATEDLLRVSSSSVGRWLASLPPSLPFTRPELDQRPSCR